jgi:hypothetical protein
MSFAAWASPPLPTTAIARDFLEFVVSLQFSVVSEEKVSTPLVTADVRWVRGAANKCLESMMILRRLKLFFRNATAAPVPPPPGFCAKSAESLENKGVEFLLSAKECTIP